MTQTTYEELLRIPDYKCPYHGQTTTNWMIFHDGTKETVLCTLCIRDCLLANGVQELRPTETE